MQSLGFALIVMAVLALVVGVLQRRKAGTILGAPFRSTGDAAHALGGVVSCEGDVHVTQPIFAPCSGRPCLYYEIDVVQSWTSHLVTAAGVQTEHGATTVQSLKWGDIFLLDDGSGPVAIDPRAGMDGELERSFEQEVPVGRGRITCGQFSTRVPSAGDGKEGVSIRVIERIVPAEGSLCVVGAVADAAIGKTAGAAGSLLVSRKGRDGFIGATKRNATIGFAVAAMSLVPGTALAAFAEPAAASPEAHPICAMVDEASCSGAIVDDRGAAVRFTVTAAGTFRFFAGSPAVHTGFPLLATIRVDDEDGHAVAAPTLSDLSLDLQPGTYTVTIADSFRGEAKAAKQGIRYELFVARTALATPPAVVVAQQLAPVVVAAPEPVVEMAPPKKARAARVVAKAPKAAAKKAAGKGLAPRELLN